MTTAPPASPPPLLEVRCRDCGATLVLPSHRFAAVCPYCASGAVVDRPADPTADAGRRVRPDFAVGFVFPRERAEALVRAWLSRSRLFTPRAVRQADIARVEGIYLPAWLYGAVARTHYEATIGEDYWETETYTTTDSKGRTVTRTRQVRRTEHRALAGVHATYVIDLVVSAAVGLDHEELEQIEPFDLGAMRRFDPSLVAGWAAEEATRDRREGYAAAREEALDFVGRRLRAFLPGDSASLDSWTSDFSEESTDLVLLPVWVFAARWKHGEKEERLRILLNGQTGAIHGDLPRSGARIAGLVVLVLLVLAALVLLVGALTGGLAL